MDFDEIRNEIREDIQKRLAEITKGHRLDMQEAVFVTAMLEQGKWNGEFEYTIENGHAQMKIKMNKVQIIQMCAQIADSAFDDKYDFITRILAFDTVNKVMEKITGEPTSNRTAINCAGKTEAEIDLIKELFKKSPEELMKLKEQMNE